MDSIERKIVAIIDDNAAELIKNGRALFGAAERGRRSQRQNGAQAGTQGAHGRKISERYLPRRAFSSRARNTRFSALTSSFSLV